MSVTCNVCDTTFNLGEYYTVITDGDDGDYRVTLECPFCETSVTLDIIL